LTPLSVAADTCCGLKDTVATPVTVTGAQSYCPDLSRTSAQSEGS
jgi:hypothetical protein